MGLLKKFLPFLGIFLFIWILFTQVNPQKILFVIKNVSVPYMLTSIIFMLIIAILKYLRIFIFLRTLNIKLSPLSILRIYTSSILLSQVTTFLVSVFAATAATIISNKGEKKIRIGNAYIAANFFDFLFAVLIFILCLFFDRTILVKLSLNKLKLLLSGIILFSAIIIFFFIVKNYYEKHYREIILSTKQIFLPAILTTLIIWIFYILTCFFEARTFGVFVSLPYLLIVYISGSIVTALPISIGGLGTRDIIFIYLLSLKGIPHETSLLLSLFSYILNPFFSMFSLYLLSIIVREEKMR